MQKKKKKHAEEIIEWGSTKEKITRIAKIKNIKSITLKKQDNEFFKEIVSELKANNLTVRII